ncbi:hypothetical protein [Stutzerimonas stutzeri]|uniref:hypothetical protein n=1 Tax=Stutzerimonas stutzeri TaxID=316 RepID=UPI003C6F3BEB
MEIFTVLGLDGLGRWSRNSPPIPALNSDNHLPVAEIGLAAAITINCTAMYWATGLKRMPHGERPKATAA